MLPRLEFLLNSLRYCQVGIITPSYCPDDVVRRKRSAKKSSKASMMCITARDPKRLK
jgi:hypothetical protein